MDRRPVAPKYRDPRPSPRGPEPLTIEAVYRASASARLTSYRVPQFAHFDMRYRQLVVQGRDRAPLGPYAPISQELHKMIEAQEKASNGRSA